MGDVMAFEEYALVTYSEEVTWGTDPLASRLPFLGVMRNWKVTTDHNVEAYYEGQNAQPQGYMERARDVHLTFECDLKDDNPANSLLAFAFGGVPNGGTGVVTNRHSLTNRDLRSFTMQAGIDWSQTDEWWRVRGCKIRRAEIDWNFKQHLVKAKMDVVPRYFDKQSTPHVDISAISPSALAPFDPQAHGTYTLANPTIAGIIANNLKVVVENGILTDGVIKSGAASDRYIGLAAPIGTSVFVELDTYRSVDDFLDQYTAARDTAAAEVDFTLTLSRAAAAQFIKITLTDCQLLGAYDLEWRMEKGVAIEHLRFQAKTWQLDVLTP